MNIDEQIRGIENRLTALEKERVDLFEQLSFFQFDKMSGIADNYLYEDSQVRDK